MTKGTLSRSHRELRTRLRCRFMVVAAKKVTRVVTQAIQARY